MEDTGRPAQNSGGVYNLPKGILIAGAAKSGTTALFYAIQNALSVELNVSVEGLFEPHSKDVKSYCQNDPDKVRLVKMLLGPLLRRGFDFGDSFDKKLLVFRDPRDNVVSRIHFMVKRIVSSGERDKVQQILQLFVEKEQKPDEVGVLSVLRAFERISGRDGLAENVRANSLLPARFLRSHGDSFFVIPYDELVGGHFERLSEYLGFKVPSDFQVAGKHAHIVRSRTSGAWRDWFLDEDTQFFAKDVADDFRFLGFDPNATPNFKRQVDPEKTSAYVNSIFNWVEDNLSGKGRRRLNKPLRQAERAARMDDGARRARKRAKNALRAERHLQQG